MYYVKLNQMNTMKQGDTIQRFTARITDQYTSPVDLTSSTVTFYLGSHQGVRLEKTVTIEDAADGVVSFFFNENDVTGSGALRGEFRVEYENEVFTAPTNGYLRFAINKKLTENGNEFVTPLLYDTFKNIVSSFDTYEERFKGIESDVTQLKSGNNGSVSTFETLTDLQNAYPNGSVDPVWVVADNAWYYWSGTVTEDTTAPVITISPNGSTFTSTQQITLSSNENATIYYTLDGSTPTQSSLVYTSPINITSTKTLKCFGEDSAGNVSAVKTAIFTKSTSGSTYSYLSLNGGNVKTPSLTFDAIEIDFHPEQSPTVYQNYFDFRDGVSLGYMQNKNDGNDAYNAPIWNSFIVDGVTKTGLNTTLVPRNVRSKVKFILSTPGTDDVNIFSDKSGAEPMPGKIYTIKFYNGATVVAFYDMATGTVQDQSGNGKHATLTGGTFI